VYIKTTRVYIWRLKTGVFKKIQDWIKELVLEGTAAASTQEIPFSLGLNDTKCERRTVEFIQILYKYFVQWL
jgi:hypothetical protein